MATQSPSELESFHEFLTRQLQGGDARLSPEESVKAFRAYQDDLQRFRQDIQPALQRSLQGSPNYSTSGISRPEEGSN